MAQPITWQNVSVGSNLGANQLLDMAQAQYSNAFKGLGDIAQGLRNDNLAREKANSEAQFNWFTEQARNLKPEQFTPETMNALLANVTDPTARQAAVESFGKLGDEITGRAFQQEKRQAFTADEAQKALLRPLEVKKANLDLDLEGAQIKAQNASAASAYASANAANANANYTKLQTQEFQQQLNEAKTARAKEKTLDKLVDTLVVPVVAGGNPADGITQLKKANLPGDQLAYAIQKYNARINTLNTLDPVTQKEVADTTNKINTNYTNTIAAIDAQDKYNQSKFPVESVYTQVVGQEDINKKVKGIADSAADAYTSVFGVNALGYSDARHVMPSIKKGLDNSAVDFYDQLKIELGTRIKDPKVVDSIIAEEMNNGGVYKVQSLALDNLQYDPDGTKKIYEISSDGRELTTEINRMIRPYATNVANLYFRKKLEDEANIERSEAAARQANGLRALAASTKLVGSKDEQDKPNLAKSIADFFSKSSSANTTVGNPAGLVENGNIDLSARPTVKNKDGSISTVRSMSINVDGNEVLIPTVSDSGKIMTDKEAIDTYMRTGRHLGKFNSVAAANKYAEALHRQQEKLYKK